MNNTRIKSLLVVTTGIGIFWIISLFLIQVLDVNNFKDKASRQYVPGREVILPQRGAIYDRNGELLVSTQKNYSMEIDLVAIKEYAKYYSTETDKIDVNDIKKNIAKIISSYIDLNYNEVIHKLNPSTNRRCVPISDKISELAIKQIKEDFRKEKYRFHIINFNSFKRVYQKGALAARLLGAVTSDIDEDLRIRNPEKTLYELKGICGIEKSFNDVLSGVHGWQDAIYEANTRIPIAYEGLKSKPAVDGKDIYLTIDSDIQEIVSNVLESGLKKTNAKNAVGIVMSAETGEIYAMSSINSEDKVRDINKLRTLPNLCVSFLYEPGSTMKPVTAAAALQYNTISIDDTVNCRSRTEYFGKGRNKKKRIIDDDDHDFHDLSLRDIIAKSSNPGISRVSDRIDDIKLYNMFRDFGFGRKTGTDFNEEAKGLIRPIDKWTSYSKHSLSFGHEISVTPLQVATAYVTIANDGKPLKPYILRGLKEDNGSIEFSKSREGERILKKNVVKDVQSALEAVVEYGTGSKLNLDYLNLAGKTGTAEKLDPLTKRYTNKYFASFSGYFPTDNPKFVVFVMFDEASYYYRTGSLSAGVSVNKISRGILSLPRYRIAEKEVINDIVLRKVPDVKGLNVEQAKTILTQNKILCEIKELNREGIVTEQIPEAGAEVGPGQKVILVIDNVEVNNANNESGSESDEMIKMPDLTGLTLRKAIQIAQNHNIGLEISGKGLVITQSIEYGKELKAGTVCKVKLR